MDTVARFIDKLNDLIGRSAAWLALAMVVLMFFIVVQRYVFRDGSIALQESIMYLNALIFTLGAGYTLKEQGHVRVDIFYSRFSPKRRALVDLLGTLVFLGLCMGYIAWESWDYISVSWRIREGSPEASGLPFVYLLKSSIYLLVVLVGLQGFAEVCRAISVLRSPAGRPGEAGKD
jgi:TRAP-type mannitol/chloroaromatic compound transport system permease small subunit